MILDAAIQTHYGAPGLADRILGALAKRGTTSAEITAEALAPFDEFHVGGIVATRRFAGRMKFKPGSRVLDLGCGTGGPARIIASENKCHVSGIDLTGEFINAGRQLTATTGLSDAVSLYQGSILDLPFDEGAFDAVMMMHVGMNIADKSKLMAEAFRVLRVGGIFGIYDIMRPPNEGANNEGSSDDCNSDDCNSDDNTTIVFPLPWAPDASVSAVERVDVYSEVAEAAGFSLFAQYDETGNAAASLARMTDSGPANNARNLPDRFHNLAAHFADGRLVTTEIYFTRPER